MTEERLTELNDEQVAALDVVRDEWLAHGLSTQPANREEAELGVREAYAAAGLEPPGMTIWLDSPMAGAIGAWILTVIGSDEVRTAQEKPPKRNRSVEALVNLVESEVQEVWRGVLREVLLRVADSVTRDEGPEKANATTKAITAEVERQLRENPREVWSQIRSQMYRCGYGQHDASWLSFYDFFGRFCGLEKEVERLNGVIRIGRSAGWWWPFSGAVVLTERPVEMHRDAQGRLHCETGPALRYPDNWDVWVWHGVRVESWVIDGTATIQKILSEPNTEVRRCAIEAYGWPRFIEDAKLDLVGGPTQDPGNPEQSLTLYSIPERIYDEPVNVLIATNGTMERDGTRRTFGLTVPADINDPVAAAAWGYGLEPGDYAEMVRRS